MHSADTEDLTLDLPPRPLWRALRDLAISAVVVGAIALIVGFVPAT